MKTLILNRHAKSDWGSPDLSDFDRPLNKRGKRDTPMMVERFLKKKIKPDLIISSPANRALTTAKQFADALKMIIKEEIEIYNGSERYFKKELENFDDKINTILAFGHNPDFTSLATYFSGEFFANIPTCGIVCIDFDINTWKDIHKENGTIRFFDYPKSLNEG